MTNQDTIPRNDDKTSKLALVATFTRVAIMAVFGAGAGAGVGAFLGWVADWAAGGGAGFGATTGLIVGAFVGWLSYRWDRGPRR